MLTRKSIVIFVYSIPLTTFSCTVPPTPKQDITLSLNTKSKLYNRMCESDKEFVNV